MVDNDGETLGDCADDIGKATNSTLDVAQAGVELLSTAVVD